MLDPRAWVLPCEPVGVARVASEREECRLGEWEGEGWGAGQLLNGIEEGSKMVARRKKVNE